MTSVRDVMTPDPLTVPVDAPVAEAARLMRDHDIGDVLVVTDDRVTGIVTDRDIAVRAVAESADPDTTTVGEICSSGLVTVSPTDDLREATDMMREYAVRRVPVLEDERPVGILSIGDLAMNVDPDSALAEISEDAPNN
jgi:CBS domain-containing protein